MVVFDKRRNHNIEFRGLENGDTFLNSKGVLCLKINPVYNEVKERFNTVQLKTGILSCTSDYDVVSQVAATVTFTDIN